MFTRFSPATDCLSLVLWKHVEDFPLTIRYGQWTWCFFFFSCVVFFRIKTAENLTALLTGCITGRQQVSWPVLLRSWYNRDCFISPEV